MRTGRKGAYRIRPEDRQVPIRHVAVVLDFFLAPEAVGLAGELVKAARLRRDGLTCFEQLAMASNLEG